MKLLNRHETVQSIFTLLRESNTKFIIVSPYIDFFDWKELTDLLEEHRNANKELIIYTRNGTNQDIECIKSISTQFYTINNLHCKIYMNESTAVLTSMNLVNYSAANNIEFGQITENIQELQTVANFIQKEVDNNQSTIEKILVKFENRINGLKLLNDNKNCVRVHYQEEKLFIVHNYYTVVVSLTKAPMFIQRYWIHLEFLSENKLNYIKKMLPFIKESIYYLFFNKDWNHLYGHYTDFHTPYMNLKDVLLTTEEEIENRMFFLINRIEQFIMK